MSSILASDCVLLHADGLPGCIFHRNGTTAEAVASNGAHLEVSLSCPERPVLPTILFVHCLCADFDAHPPRIVCAVEDLLLIRILVGLPPEQVSPADYDYFIYRAPGLPTSSSRGPSLKLLSRPHPTFHNDDVGLLCRGDGHFTIAALIATDSADVYDLHRFHSEAGTWSHVQVKVAAPRDRFPCKIPRTMFRLFSHVTSTVVTIGGEAGTMGWVDLWHGVLLCDVLDPKPALRGVPLPLPMELLALNNGRGADIGCPKSLRGISFVRHPGGGQGGCLRFVHLEATAAMVPLPSGAGSDSDEEIHLADCDWAMYDWAVTTWSNYKMSTSWDDWNLDCKAKASNTSVVSSKLKSKMLKSGLLSPGGSGTDSSEETERGLQNLFVSHPAPGMDNNGVVYLQARVKFQGAKAFVLALDTSNNQLLAAAEFATETRFLAGIKHLPSNISKYIDPQDRVLRVPKDDDGAWEESSLYEGTESLVLPDVAELLIAGLNMGLRSSEEMEPKDFLNDASSVA